MHVGSGTYCFELIRRFDVNEVDSCNVDEEEEEEVEMEVKVEVEEEEEDREEDVVEESKEELDVTLFDCEQINSLSIFIRSANLESSGCAVHTIGKTMHGTTLRWEGRWRLLYSPMKDSRANSLVKKTNAQRLGLSRDGKE